MGPVRQNPIQRTASLFICVCITLCTIVAHNIAQNRPDSLTTYPPDNHHCSDDVYLREGGYKQPSIMVNNALIKQHKLMQQITISKSNKIKVQMTEIDIWNVIFWGTTDKAFLRDRCPSHHPDNSVKALKETQSTGPNQLPGLALTSPITGVLRQSVPSSQLSNANTSIAIDSKTVLTETDWLIELRFYIILDT